MRVKWNREQALELCAVLSAFMKPEGFGIALAGSVLTEGQSAHDLDLVVFPLDTSKKGKADAADALTRFGMEKIVEVAAVHARWRTLGSGDEKHVEVWFWKSKRIDIFTLT